MPYLSRTDALIADAVVQLLTYGGHREDVHLLTRCAMVHTRRRTFGCLVDDPATIRKLLEEFIESDMAHWKADLALAWRRNKRADPQAFEPETITERIRANVRDELRGHFEHFIKDAPPEESRFLDSVYGYWGTGYRDNRHHGRKGATMRSASATPSRASSATRRATGACWNTWWSRSSVTWTPFARLNRQGWDGMKKRSPLTCEQLVNMDDLQKQHLSDFAKVVVDNGGCSTPAEEFPQALANTYVNWNGITREDIEAKIQEFRENRSKAAFAGDGR
jgi:hypothetical protein